MSSVISVPKTKHPELLKTDQKRLVELLALEAPLTDILDALLRMIEARSGSGLLGSILLVDSANARLRFGAAPSLPDAYNRAIDGLPIGEGIGCCGTAAFVKHPVQAADIARDPRWKDFRQLAARHGLGACWSTPILAKSGAVLGTFAMYYPIAREADDNDLQLVETVTRVAAIVIERDRVQENLRISEERYQLVNQATNDIIWDWDFISDTISWNNAMKAQLGYSREEFSTHGKDWYEKIHPDDRERVVSGLYAVIGGGEKTWTDEYRMRKKDNTYAVFLDRGFVARDASGKAYRMIGSMLDLTERKRTEQALLDSQMRFGTIVNQTIVGMVQADANGRMTLVNQRWCEMLGYSEAELLEMSILDVTHEISMDETAQAVARLAAGGPDFVIDKRYVRKDGSFFWASSGVNALRNSADEFCGLVAMIIDTTERRHVEEALQVSEKNSRDTLQSIADGFLALDNHRRFAYVNRAAERMLNRTADELIGKKFGREYPDIIGTEFERHYRQVEATRKALIFTAYYPDHSRWYEVNVSPAINGISLYFRDVTERIEGQEALRQRHEHSRLIADISEWLVLRASDRKAESVNQLLESVFMRVAQHLDAEYYFNFEVTDDKQMLRLLSSHGLDEQQRNTLGQMLIGERLCGRVAAERQPVILEDIQNAPPGSTTLMSAMGVQAYAGFPLLVEGHLLGTIAFATAKRPRFAREELELIQTVADLLAAAVQREYSTAALQASEQKYRDLFNSIDEAYCTAEVLFDDSNNPVDYRYLQTNPAFEKQSGLSNAVGKTIRELTSGIEDYWVQTWGRVALTGQPIRCENYVASLDRWFNCYAFRLSKLPDNKIGILFSDITERKRREISLALLAEVQQDFALLADASSIMQSVGEKIRRHFGFAGLGFADICESTGTASTIYSTQAAGFKKPMATHLLGDFLDEAHLAQMRAGKAVALDDIAGTATGERSAAYAHYQVGAAIHVPYISDGRWKFSLSGAYAEPHHWRADEIELLSELASRIYLHLERTRALLRVSESEAHYRALIDASSEAMYRMSADLTNLIFIEGGDFIASSANPQSDWLEKYVHPEDQALVLRTWRRALRDKKMFEHEHRVRRVDGSWGWTSSRAVPLYDDKGEIVEWFGAASDITDRKRFEDTLWQSANFDSLTGLPNRRLFHDRLDQEIKKAHRSGLTVALFFIDLDRFKEVNDLHGHAIGDALLVEAAKRISACVREFDTVARLGGDEFTAILSELEDKAHSENVAQKIIDTLARPFRIGHQTVHLSSSIGITYFPDDAANADDMIRNADQAMYAAKYAGRNRYHYFIQRMQHEVQDRLRLIEDLRNAASGGQFEVYYQPVVDLHNGEIVKAEALLRWHHPQQGNIDPSVFIPFAEDSGLINEIGDWVFTEAAACSKACEVHTGRPFQISVNKSPLQFLANGRSMDWLSYLENHHLSARSISIEITEGLLLNTSQETRSKLKQLRNAGIQVAIDDFGTGYSSMAYLKEFEIDYLKIDQSFIHEMASDKAHFAIVRSMIAMAHELDIKVIAEGIETSEQQALLLDAGCDFGQGYLFAQARPPAEFLRLLNQH